MLKIKYFEYFVIYVCKSNYSDKYFFLFYQSFLSVESN